MLDRDFKNASHCIGDLFIATTGQTVSSGYKPDVTIKNNKNELKFILESEKKTDRKVYVGALIKAEYCAENLKAHPQLIIVVQESDNTTVLQIADHLRPYKVWLQNKNGGSLYLSAVHVLSDIDYLESINAQEILGSTSFQQRGYLI